MVQPSISGIMVDGIKVGESVSSEKLEEGKGVPEGCFLDSQDFQDADMVVIKRKPLSVKGKKVPQCFPEVIAKETIYICYGIYGNTLVEATINESNIHKGLHKKYVWATRKPYILNGERLYHAKN